MSGEGKGGGRFVVVVVVVVNLSVCLCVCLSRGYPPSMWRFFFKAALAGWFVRVGGAVRCGVVRLGSGFWLRFFCFVVFSGLYHSCALSKIGRRSSLSSLSVISQDQIVRLSACFS